MGGGGHDQDAPAPRRRWRRLGGEAARFSVVNVVATVVAVLLFNLAVHGVPGAAGPLSGWPLTAWFVANCVGMAISYWGSRRWAFRRRRPAGPGEGALSYVAINLASFVVPMACLWVSRRLLDQDGVVADNLAANVVGALLGALLRFWAFRRFVFRRRRGAEGREPVASRR